MRLTSPVRFRAVLLGVAVLVAPALSACGGTTEYTLTNMPANLAVNPFMWQAALDTLKFVPLASADPATGRIRTQWAPSGSGVPGEETMVDVLIVGRELRSDYLAVDVYRRVNGAPAAVNPQAAIDVHTAIITRARQLMSSAENY